MHKFLFISILVLFSISCSQKKTRELIVLKGQTMGTTYSIKIISNSKSFRKEELKKNIDSVLVDVNNKMSTYIKNSELSEFNKLQDTNWISASYDLVTVFSEAIEVSRKSEGMYDITVGPLVNLWGFGPGNKTEKIPSKKEIDEIKKNIGYKNILIDSNKLKIKKRNPDIYCDLSSIAKGYGVDKVAMYCDSKNINNYMIEIGGEVRTKGKNQKGNQWRIGIASPNNIGLQNIVNLSNYSMATSGDYLNYFEKDGIRYSHTINPKTGKPITHKLASVSVIYKDCSYADAYATAIDVMGPEVGYKFALQQNLPIFMIVRQNNEFVEKMTPQFKKFITKGN